MIQALSVADIFYTMLCAAYKNNSFSYSAYLYYTDGSMGNLLSVCVYSLCDQKKNNLYIHYRHIFSYLGNLLLIQIHSPNKIKLGNKIMKKF